MAGELRDIRDQMSSDFKAIMIGLSTQRDAMGGAVHSITRAIDELRVALDVMRQDMTTALDAQQSLLAGYMERTEARFDRIVAIVEEQEGWRSTVDERLDAIEKRLVG